MKLLATFAALTLLAPLAFAKLPVLNDEAKAKAAEATAKTAHGNKIADFQLCKSMDRIAARYQGEVRKAGKEAKPATATAACADPGVFAVAPPAGAPSAVPAAAPAAPAAAAPPKKS